MTARGPAAQGRCISLLPAVSAVSALFIAAAVSSHRRKGPVFSPHLGRTRGVRPPFLPGGIVCPAQKKDARGRLFFCDCPQVLLSVLPHTARKGECEGETFAGFPTRVQSSARRRHFCTAKVPHQKRRGTHTCVSSFLVRAMGLEPPRPYGHKHLKLACLPIPARSHAEHLAIITKCPCLSRGRRKNPRLAPRSFLCYNCSSTCPMGPSTVTAACAGPAPPLFTTASLCPR